MRLLFGSAAPQLRRQTQSPDGVGKINFFALQVVFDLRVHGHDNLVPDLAGHLKHKSTCARICRVMRVQSPSFLPLLLGELITAQLHFSLSSAVPAWPASLRLQRR